MIDDEPDTLGDLASAASEVTDPNEETEVEMLESIRQGCLGNELPKPINLLELAKPRTPLPEVKFTTDFTGVAKNRIVDEMFEPKPLRRL